MSNEADFLHVDKHESLQQINSIILMGIFKHSQSSQNSEFAISLQHLKKADKRQSFYKLVLSFLVEVQNTQNRKLVIFLQYIRKKLLQLIYVLL